MSDPFPDAPPARKLDRLCAALAFLLATLVPLLAWPLADAPFNDDFAYARMARQVAETGTYSYSAWVAPIVGPQAYYGALIIKLFGPSYTALHLSVLPLAGGASLLLYHLARAAGLSPTLALQAALGCMLSPIAIPLSASFMTDIPGQFLGLLALVAAYHATREGSRFPTLLFAAALMLSYFGGMVRQTNWLIGLCIAPVIVFLPGLPRSRRFLWGILTLAACAAIVQANRVNAATPFVIPYSLTQMFGDLFRLPPSYLAHRAAEAAHSAVWVALPALIAFAPTLRRPSGRNILLTLSLLAGIAVLLTYQESLRSPSLGNFLTPHGLLGNGTDLPGERPQLLPDAGLLGFSLLRWAILAALVTAAFGMRQMSLRGLLANRALLYLALFALLTLGLTLLRTLTAVAFDRYYLSALPAAFVMAGLFQMRIGRPAGTRTAWAAVTAFALFGVALTFDYQAALRARLAALSALQSRGISRSAIAAGFEIDLHEQLARWGYANVGQLRSPPGAVLPLQRNPAWPGPLVWTWGFAPAISPQYVVTRSPLPGYDPAPTLLVPYFSVLPPFRRVLLVQRVSDPTVPPYFPPPPHLLSPLSPMSPPARLPAR